MSLLQRKNIHKRHLLWAKIVGICLFFHLIFLFWIFCIYQENNYMLSLSINKNIDYSAPIIFVPLGVPTTTKPQPTMVKKINPIQQPAAPNKTVKKTTTIAPETPKKPTPTTKKITPVAPKAEPKKEEKKEVVKVEPPKIEPKKIEPEKTEPIKESAKVEPPKKIVKEIIDVQQITAPVIPENAHISHNYREAEALRMQAQLQKEVVKQWKPPIGVSPECSCDISFFINTKGGVENIKIIKNSGVMMFDISTRQALCATKMPQWTYGKTLTFHFKQ